MTFRINCEYSARSQLGKPDLHQTCTRLAPDLHQTCTRLARCSQFGAILLQVWCEFGAGAIVRVWFCACLGGCPRSGIRAAGSDPRALQLSPSEPPPSVEVTSSDGGGATRRTPCRGEQPRVCRARGSSRPSGAACLLLSCEMRRTARQRAIQR